MNIGEHKNGYYECSLFIYDNYIFDFNKIFYVF